jgi:hypothetical protein
MMVKNLVELRLVGEAKVFGENLPQRHFVQHKSHLSRPATSRLSYGAAKSLLNWTQLTELVLFSGPLETEPITQTFFSNKKQGDW